LRLYIANNIEEIMLHKTQKALAHNTG